MIGRRRPLAVPKAVALAVTVLTAAAASLAHAQPASTRYGPPYVITGGFLHPYGLAVDQTHGRLLVADTAHHRFKWTAVADLLGSYTFAEHGYVANRSDPNALTDPQGIAVDGAGNVYVVNTLAGTVKLYTWNGGAYALDAAFASTNPHTVDGQDMQMPRDVAVGPNGAVYLLDSGNNRILRADGPTDTSWSVFHADATWSNPYGLDVDASGALYVADTGNHRIVRLAGSTSTTFGRFGTDRGELRFPRDVAVDAAGRMFVADTFNHRIQVLAADGSYQWSLGHAPGLGTIDKVEVDAAGRIFAVDSDHHQVLAFLGSTAPRPFDPYVRDYLGDPGTEPSDARYTLGSPDVLVRHQPDVDVRTATTLDGLAFQQPRFGQVNYVYLAVHNRGTQTVADSLAKVFWYDPGTAGRFPEDWSQAGFYTAYSDDTHNTPSNTLPVPSVAANATVLVGPLLWLPPPPESAAAGDGGFRLAVRVLNQFDYPPPEPSPAAVRDSNNVAERRVLVARGPFTVGRQDTLVVRVNFPDVPGEADEATVTARVAELGQWLNEVSYGTATLVPLFRGPVTLAHNRSTYLQPSQSVLVDMTTEVLRTLLAAEPGLLDGATAAPEDDLDRVILVLNDPAYTGDWATTGNWPYDLETFWARQFGTGANDRGEGVAADASAVYVVGLASGVLPGHTISTNGTDTFIRKYDPSGSEVWTRQFNGQADIGPFVAIAASGVVIAGGTELTLPGQTPAGNRDAYVRMYTRDGDEAWTRQFGSPELDEVLGVATDASGVYVAGRPLGALPGQTALFREDAFVRKYDADGNELWTRQFGTAADDRASAICADASGVYVAGDTDDVLPGAPAGSSPGAFVRKYGPDGTVLWTRQIPSSAARRVAVTSSGLYVAGLTGVSLSGQPFLGFNDLFVRKYALDGTEVWTREFGTAGKDGLNGLAVGASGVHVTGITDSSGAASPFLRTYDLDGNEVSTETFPRGDTLAAVAAAGASLYVAGTTERTLPDETPFGASDAFLQSFPEGPRRLRYLSVSVQGPANPMPFYAHGFGHQLTLVDLYAYPNVTFPRPYADGWDNMALPMNGVHPLVWSKELGHWVTSLNARIAFIPRPAPGVNWNNGGNAIPVYAQATAAPGETVGVAFGLTNGVTSFTDEAAFYYVEARRKKSDGADGALPGSGVLMYYVGSRIPQGQGPVILRDHVPGGGLDDAAIPLGGSESPGGTGISVLVQPGTGGADYNLAVQYNPPATDYDVSMRLGDPPWESPDIWVDNQADGYDEPGRPPADRGNQGIAGEENRVYAHVANAGPAEAFDVEVAFQFSEPYPTVGEDFQEYRSVFIDRLPGGQDTSRYVTWTPRTGIDPHTCARVVLRRLFNDTNPANDVAQRNLTIDHSVHGSPYGPLAFAFQIRNQETLPQLLYFRADGVPSDWTWTVSPARTLAAPGATVSGTLRLQPPPGAPDCTSHRVFVTGWTPRGDTLVRLGGATVRVDLQQRTRLDVKLALEACQRKDREDPDNPDASCRRLRAYGCTDPRQPFQDIVIRYEGPDGEPVYRTVRTDANGCFDDFQVVVEGGEWQVEAQTPPTVCLAPAVAQVDIVVPLPESDQPESDLAPAEHALCVSGLSKDMAGRIESSIPDNGQPPACGTKGVDQVVHLDLSTNKSGKGFDLPDLDGTLEIPDLRHLLAGPPLTGGLHRGRFRWKSPAMEAVGFVAGFTDVGTHYGSVCRRCTERGPVPRHWELSLTGTVVAGPLSGSRLRAVLALDGTAGATTLKGALEGVVERDCSLSPAQRNRRVRRAREEAAAAAGSCGALPCLSRISKSGTGEMTLDQQGQERCREERCSVRKAWSRLRVALKGDASLEGSAPFLTDGTLSADSFFQVLASDLDRGEHGGTFRFETKDGVRVEGEMLGLSEAGSHRPPSARPVETHEVKGHLEGRLVGRVLNSRHKGLIVETRYAMQVDGKAARRQRFVMTWDGWGVAGCLPGAGKETRR